MSKVVLPEALTIESVVPIRATLLEAFANGAVVELDARAVEDVDGAGIQLLLSAAKEAALREASLTLEPSTALLETLELLAVTDRFALATPEAPVSTDDETDKEASE